MIFCMDVGFHFALANDSVNVGLTVDRLSLAPGIATIFFPKTNKPAQQTTQDYQ